MGGWLYDLGRVGWVGGCVTWEGWMGGCLCELERVGWVDGFKGLERINKMKDFVNDERLQKRTWFEVGRSQQEIRRDHSNF